MRYSTPSMKTAGQVYNGRSLYISGRGRGRGGTSTTMSTCPPKLTGACAINGARSSKDNFKLYDRLSALKKLKIQMLKA